MTSVTDLQRPRVRTRLKVFEPAVMRVRGATTKVHLLDLSTRGALVHALKPPAISARVQISCGGALRSARVVWACERRFGVAFITPLSEEEVNDAIAHRRAVVAIASARIGKLSR